MEDFHQLKIICQDYTQNKADRVQEFLVQNNNFCKKIQTPKKKYIKIFLRIK
jgi:hypothetical protein